MLINTEKFISFLIIISTFQIYINNLLAQFNSFECLIVENATFTYIKSSGNGIVRYQGCKDDIEKKIVIKQCINEVYVYTYNLILIYAQFL